MELLLIFEKTNNTIQGNKTWGKVISSMYPRKECLAIGRPVKIDWITQVSPNSDKHREIRREKMVNMSNICKEGIIWK